MMQAATHLSRSTFTLPRAVPPVSDVLSPNTVVPLLPA
jgi:hypothetical protein